MKKLLIILLVLFLLPLAAFGSDLKVNNGSLAVNGGTAVLSSATVDCPSCFFRSGWEGTGVLDSSAWDSESGTTGHLTVATDQFFTGSHALKISSTAATEVDYLSKAITATGTIGIRFPIRINSSSAGEFDQLHLYSGAQFLLSVEYLPGSGGINVYNGGGGVDVGSFFALTADTWYQFEVKFVSGTSISWRVWDAAGTTLVRTEQTSTTGVYALNADTIRFGLVDATGVTNIIFWMDTFAASNTDYPGPYIP